MPSDASVKHPKMGSMSINNCDPIFRATACLGQCGNLYNLGTKMSEKRRCFRSNNSMLNASIHEPQKDSSKPPKDSSIMEMDSILEDKDQTFFQKLSGESNRAVEDIEFEFKMFLEHLREDGTSYVLEMVNCYGKHIHVKYEEENLQSVEIDNPKSSGGILSKKTRACLDKKNQKSQTSSEIGVHLGKMNQKSQLSSETSEMSKRLGRKNKAKMSSETNGYFAKRSKTSQTLGLKNKGSMDNSSELVFPLFPSRDHNPNPLVDESYQIFLNHVRIDGDSLVLELPNVVINYEEDKEVSTSLEGCTTLSTLCCSEQESKSPAMSKQSFASSATDDEGTSQDSFQFEEQLMASLNRPFDQDEYVDLLYRANVCKPLEREINLRTRSVDYKTRKDGMSYFGYYPDLKRQVKSADPQRALTLLRGFFFWLKYKPRDGSFMPWVTSHPSNDNVVLVDDEDATFHGHDERSTENIKEETSSDQ